MCADARRGWSLSGGVDPSKALKMAAYRDDIFLHNTLWQMLVEEKKRPNGKRKAILICMVAQVSKYVHIRQMKRNSLHGWLQQNTRKSQRHSWEEEKFQDVSSKNQKISNTRLIVKKHYKRQLKFIFTLNGLRMKLTII